MRFWQGVAVGLTLLLVLASQAQEKPQKVGTVLDIDGPRLMTNRLKEQSWFQAYPSMATNLGEKMKSDAATTATLEFAIGGRAVISPGTEIEIVGQRDIETVGNKVVVKSGKMWAKIDKQSSQLQIQTAGGTMGIEGTEFVVEVDGAETDLSMLEGTVSVTSANGKVDRVIAGQGARFGHKGIARRQLAREILEALDSGEPGAARELLLQRTGFPALSRNAVRLALVHRVAGKGANSRLFRNAALACRKSRKMAAGPRRRKRRQPEAVEPVSGLRVEGALPSFAWHPVAGASRYSLALTADSEGEDPVWSVVIPGTSVSYPPYGPDLEAGHTYHWTVAPLDEDGSVQHEGGQALCGTSTYVSEGHRSAPREVSSVSVMAGSGPPEVSWQPVPGAASYSVAISSDAAFDQLVWSQSTPGSSYRYPDDARALSPGEYLVRVEAFDELGAAMGVSAPRSFSTQGWTSTGAAAP